MSTKPREPWAQLVHSLGFHGVAAVVDGGANEGQYASSLRAHGWSGRVVSIEPIPEVHARLSRRAGGDPAWTVLPPMALGADEGEAVLEVSAETDMSSLRPQSELLQRISPSSAVTDHIAVRVRRLDRLELPPGPLFLKLDLQGGEAAALDGAAGLLHRVVGIQLEMALVRLYEGEPLWRETIERLERMGLELHLLLPGYYERKLGRQVQADGVFYRKHGAAPPGSAETRT